MHSLIFHLAFPCHNLNLTEKFFSALGCKVGRRSAHALILNMGGNQIVAHKVKEKPNVQKGIYPRHFGLIFSNLKEWKSLLRRARQKKLKFYQDAKVRFLGTPLEHHTFFLEDPSRNLLEFKHYVHHRAIFGKTRFKKIGDAI